MILLDFIKSNIEIAKLVVQLFVPVLAAIFAYLIAKTGVFTDKTKSINQELIKQRLSVYRDIAPKINDIFCYVNFIGRWKSFLPEEIIRHKRFCDREMHIYRSIFSKELFEAYQKLISAAFSEYNGYGESAKTYLDLDNALNNWSDEWQIDWLKYFHHKDNAEHDFYIEYHKFMLVFAKELGVA